MTRNVRIVLLTSLFLLSLGVFLFSLFFINPDYLNFSGFLFFYASIFGWLWSLFLILGHYVWRKINVSESFKEMFARRSGVFSFFIVASLFLKQMNLFSIYTIFGLVLFMILAERWLQDQFRDDI